MGSSKRNEALIFDEVRKNWVPGTPEEIIRQKLLQKMICELHFPRELLAVEKEFKQLPHLSLTERSIPERRADIICFANQIHPKYAIYPLLLIECKKEEIGESATEQLLGYNHFVQAYFVALVNDREIKFGYRDQAIERFQFISFLPSYMQLLNVVRNGSLA